MFKFFMTLFVLSLLFGGYLYFSKSSSYQKSLQAKVYYSMGNYNEAYKLSKIAYEEDRYNKMAFSIFTQSKISKAYVDYVKEGNGYLQKITTISAKSQMSAADRERIKMMCEVMTEKYQFISPTRLTKPKLLQEADKIYEKFKTLYKELF